MSKHKRGWILLALAAAWAVPAASQPVYRCGDSYSQQPCPGGKPVAVEDSRTPAQREQTTEAVRRQAAAANQLERDRLREEARVNAGKPPVQLGERQDQPDRTEAAQAKKPKQFTAVSPKKPGDPAAGKKSKSRSKPKNKATKPAG
jgi:hypothetical protein